MRLAIPLGSKPVLTHADWTLYELPSRPEDSFLWRKFKLMQPPTVRARRGARRAFRLAWNLSDLRFGVDRQIVELRSEHPELSAYVELYMSLNYTEDQLIATAEEIAAEKARLKSLKAMKKRRTA